MSKFFIHRPIFAIVVSLIIVILGVISAVQLPIAQYPQISPPSISVSTTYTGANAAVVNQTVAQIIEQQVNGTQGMDYMSSNSDDTGNYSLSVKFKLDTDGDMEALASLPTEVYTPPFLHQEQYDDIEEFLDDVSDWLSDEYGWCHFGFETETDDGGIIKCDTLPE